MALKPHRTLSGEVRTQLTRRVSHGEPFHEIEVTSTMKSLLRLCDADTAPGETFQSIIVLGLCIVSKKVEPAGRSFLDKYETRVAPKNQRKKSSCKLFDIKTLGISTLNSNYRPLFASPGYCGSHCSPQLRRLSMKMKNLPSSQRHGGQRQRTGPQEVGLSGRHHFCHIPAWRGMAFLVHISF